MKGKWDDEDLDDVKVRRGSCIVYGRILNEFPTVSLYKGLLGCRGRRGKAQGSRTAQAKVGKEEIQER